MTDLIRLDNEAPESLISMAECLGTKRLILVKEYNPKTFKKWKEEFSKIKSNIDIVFGVEINPRNPNDLQNIINQIRKEVEIILVNGGDYDINRAAVENNAVDILLHPEEERTDRGMDEYTVKQAEKNDVIIGVSFRKIMESYKKSRAFKLSFITQNLNLLKPKNIVIVSDAYTKWEMRSNRDMDDFLLTLIKKKIDTTKTLDEKINYNRKKMKQIHEGVRIVK